MSQPYEQLKLENQLCFPLYACARKITSYYTPLLKPLGLTYTQYIVFMVLWEKEKVTVGELGSDHAQRDLPVERSEILHGEIQQHITGYDFIVFEIIFQIRLY